jgi:protein-disulfide isomerase
VKEGRSWSDLVPWNVMKSLNTIQVMPRTGGQVRRLAWAGLALLLGACAEIENSPADHQAVALAAGAPAAAAAPAPEDRGDTVDLRRIGYAEGADDAPVTVIEFSDFGCPFCAMFAQGSYPEIREEFIRDGRVRWIYVPFVMGTFRNGEQAARAGECAGEQNRFEAMKLRIYSGQNEWRNTRDADALFSTFAAEVGLDRNRFLSCYREDRRGDRTRAANRAASAVGIRATPSFLINGRLVEGALPLEQFRMILNRLAEAAE